MLFTRSMSLQRFAVMELVTLAAVSICVYMGYGQTEELVRKQYFELYAVQYSGLASYMETVEEAEHKSNNAYELYSELDKRVQSAIIGTGKEETPYINVVLMKRDTTGKYIEKYAVEQNMFFEAQRVEECADLIDECMQEGKVCYRSTGDNNTVYALVAKAVEVPMYILLMGISNECIISALEELKASYILYGGLVMVVATIGYAAIIFAQNKDIRNMIRMMSRGLEDKEDWKRLADVKNSEKIRSNEMRALYTGLRHISTEFMRNNYEKIKALQVYYKFAPKDIEKIMGKNSIVDVTVNEKVSLEATLAYLSFDINERLEQHEQLDDINTYYTNLGRNRKHYGGIIYNSSSDLSTIQVMFNEEIRDAVLFGIETVSVERSLENRNKIFVLLHRTHFLYGISGDEEQAFAFAYSRDMKTIEKYVDSLRNMGIRMAVTEPVYEILPAGTQSRYVGYIEDGAYIFKLYEILDAYPAKERQGRIDTKPRFEEAMKLFGQADFYFARTIFTEILKDCPDDDVAKHYIFKCERCLEENNHNSKRFSLI